MTIIASLLRRRPAGPTPTARLDVELLLAAALGKSAATYTWPEKIVSSEHALTFADYLRRAGEPVASSSAGAWKLDLEVAPHTLIRVRKPRCWWKPPWNCCLPHQQVLDLGTGRGAIAPGLAESERPTEVTAVDRVLRGWPNNRQRLHLNNATVLNSHWFSALEGHPQPDRSNPP